MPYGNYTKRLNLLPNKTVGLCISQFPPFTTSVFLEAFCRVSCPDFCKNNSLSLLQEVLGNQIQLEHRMKLQTGFVPAARHMPRADFLVQTFKEMNTEFYLFSYWMNYPYCVFHLSMCYLIFQQSHCSLSPQWKCFYMSCFLLITNLLRKEKKVTAYRKLEFDY